MITIIIDKTCTKYILTFFISQYIPYYTYCKPTSYIHVFNIIHKVVLITNINLNLHTKYLNIYIYT